MVEQLSPALALVYGDIKLESPNTSKLTFKSSEEKPDDPEQRVGKSSSQKI